MQRTLCAALTAALFLASAVLAQGVQPIGQIHRNAAPVQSVAAIAVPTIDRAAIDNEDHTRAQQGLPARYAIPNTVRASTDTHGTWEVLDSAWSLWRLRVRAPRSSHINLGFSEFTVPPAARVMVYSSDYQNVLRPFDRADVSSNGELWTPVIGGDEIVIELYVQTVQRPNARLELSHVGAGYRFFGAGRTALGLDGGSGSCNVDVNCPQGAMWASEIPSVAAISTGGSIFCTGFMVNNTAQDGTPYFMTARHCGAHNNAASLVCYWNYERAVCGSGSGPLSQFNTGSTLRSSYSTSDFTLVQLNSQPNAAWGVTYAGWNRGSGNASSAVAIHHPSGDDKKISFENQPTTTTSYGGTSQPGNGSHVRVIDWDVGTTEPGSSGSPLFDQNHRVIGQLHGGGAACGNNLSDWYGRFSVSWSGGGSSGNRLSNWLDPLNTGQTTLDTLGSNAASAEMYGVGCYTSYSTFYETFGNGAFDLSGSASTTVSLILSPDGTGNGFNVAYGGNVWSNPTTPDLNLGDDAVTSVINLPFAFGFPGGSTSQVRMCSNGFVWLNGSSTGTDYSPTIAEYCAQAPRLLPIWVDLDPSSGGTTHYHTTPGAAHFTWNDVPPWNSSAPRNTLQCTIRSNGTIEYRYRSVTNMPQGGLVGWSRSNGVPVPPEIDISAELPFSVSVDADGLRFEPVGRPVQGTTMTMNLVDIPAGTIFGGVFLGWTQFPGGASLAGIGMPGCFQYGSQEFQFTIVTGGASTVGFPLGVPSGASWNGVMMYAQAATLSAGFNSLGALSSNGIKLKFAPN